MSVPPSDLPPLAGLRDELAALDTSLLELVARRQALVTEIGRVKSSAGRQTRDYAQEKEVVNRARRAAARLGLGEDLAEDLLLLLIRASLTVQEQDRVHASGEGGGRRVLIIGGAGKMGRWLARFLSSQGFTVEVADPAAPAGDRSAIADWRTSPLDHDIIVVAAPLRTSREVLEELSVRKPRGLVFDIGSLKTPLRPGLVALREAGVAVTSVHPMFGPDTDLLSGRHVIFVDVGHAEATRRARDLFASTMAVQVEMDLDSHDRLVAYILGLSHAVNIAFFTALAESGEKAQRLAQLSSTTFDSQLEVARRVAAENPHLYFEIQSLNDYGVESLKALLDAVQRLHDAVIGGDEAAFTAMMERGGDYLAAHAKLPGGRLSMAQQAWNFTERVRMVVAYAREEAVGLLHEYVGTEHLLLGLIRDGEGVSTAIITGLGVNPDDIATRIRTVITRGKGAPPAAEHLPYTSRAKKAIELALAEARAMNHEYIGTEHMLLGLLREQKGIAAQVLVEQGVTLELALAEAKRLLGAERDLAKHRTPARGRRRGALTPGGQNPLPDVKSVTIVLDYGGHLTARRFDDVSLAVEFLLAVSPRRD